MNELNSNTGALPNNNAPPPMAYDAAIPYSNNDAPWESNMVAPNPAINNSEINAS